ncbi:MAG: hypothetical protein A2X48_10735 [Lentisphaerae bacterium GWF2_49_21]|nr:MAG: hypothetical protein A2X48_10735 [Lentisphaerae bacterium GWF2_49_21]
MGCASPNNLVGSWQTADSSNQLLFSADGIALLKELKPDGKFVESKGEYKIIKETVKIKFPEFECKLEIKDLDLIMIEPYPDPPPVFRRINKSN